MLTQIRGHQLGKTPVCHIPPLWETATSVHVPLPGAAGVCSRAGGSSTRVSINPLRLRAGWWHFRKGKAGTAPQAGFTARSSCRQRGHGRRALEDRGPPPPGRWRGGAARAQCGSPAGTGSAPSSLRWLFSLFATLLPGEQQAKKRYLLQPEKPTWGF